MDICFYSYNCMFYHLFHCHFAAQKTIFYFSKCSEKMVFLKRLHWNIIFLVLSGKMIFFRQKMKNDLCHNNSWKYDIFFKCSEKMVFPKKSHWNMIFLVLSGKMIFFREKMKDVFVKKIHENMTFSSNVLKRWSFQRNRTGTWSFLYYLERLYFFTWKYDIFSLGGKWKMSFWRNTWKYDTLCIYV